MAGKYPETPAARIARENEEKRRKKRKKRRGFEVGKALPHDRFAPLPSGKRKKSKLGEGGGAVLSAIEKIKEPKGKKAPEWEDPDKKAPAWIDPDKKKGKTPKAKDETSDDYTFVDDFGDTDYSGSDWDWDAPFKHGGRIKKAKKAKAEARKPRSRPAIRGRRRELKGS